MKLPNKEKIYKREFYLDKIRGFYKSDLIKVITGIRRCGKSYFLLSVIYDLIDKGVSEKDIIYINLDSRGFTTIKNPIQLEEIIDSLIIDSTMKYIFIDEIQNVNDFEVTINAYREQGHSIFITGSNSYLLSGELITKLTGRYIEIEMFTLSFIEYIEMKRFLNLPIQSDNEEFIEYIRYGGFPKTLEFKDIKDKALYSQNVIDQIFKKDISRNNKIRNRFVFDRVQNFVINNFAAPISVHSIVNAFKKDNVAIKETTVSRYLKILENAKIIYKCPSFDIKSKKSLKGEVKYFLADLSIYYALNVDTRVNYGPTLENILFCYLKTKGYKISVGKIGNLECDFITRRNDEYLYIQVSMTTVDETTLKRELAPFTKISDNYPKYLFTLDPLNENINGFKKINLLEFIKLNKDL